LRASPDKVVVLVADPRNYLMQCWEVLTTMGLKVSCQDFMEQYLRTRLVYGQFSQVHPARGRGQTLRTLSH